MCVLVSNDISATVSQVYLEISNDFLFSLTVFTVGLQRVVGGVDKEGLSL